VYFYAKEDEKGIHSSMRGGKRVVSRRDQSPGDNQKAQKEYPGGKDGDPLRKKGKPNEGSGEETRK